MKVLVMSPKVCDLVILVFDGDSTIPYVPAFRIVYRVYPIYPIFLAF